MFAPPMPKTKGTTAGMRAHRRSLLAREADHDVTEQEPRRPRSASAAKWDFTKVLATAADRPAKTEPLGPVPARLQPKLRMGRTDDPLEHEADRIADQVTRLSEARFEPAHPAGQVYALCRGIVPCRPKPDRLHLRSSTKYCAHPVSRSILQFAPLWSRASVTTSAGCVCTRTRARWSRLDWWMRWPTRSGTMWCSAPDSTRHSRFRGAAYWPTSLRMSCNRPTTWDVLSPYRELPKRSRNPGMWS